MWQQSRPGRARRSPLLVPTSLVSKLARADSIDAAPARDEQLRRPVAEEQRVGHVARNGLPKAAAHLRARWMMLAAGDHLFRFLRSTAIHR